MVTLLQRPGFNLPRRPGFCGIKCLDCWCAYDATYKNVHNGRNRWQQNNHLSVCDVGLNVFCPVSRLLSGLIQRFATSYPVWLVGVPLSRKMNVTTGLRWTYFPSYCRVFFSE